MHKLKQRLFCTCATALAMGAVASILPAQAQQGFLGNVTGTFGSEGIGPSISGANNIISLSDRESIIDWQPSDQNGTGPIDFLPQANSVLFQEQVSATITDFTVLNRIQPTTGAGVPVSRVIELNGTIQSRFNGVAGGSVWFYTPGGFAVGANSVFDVGNLVLTSNQIDTTGGLYGANNTIRFRGAVGSTAGVTIASGAQITASSSNSYIALVAPRVVQGGTVSVNGSTAYVGAEQADIRINGGLFDIAVTVGTTDAHGVEHTGTTTGPASVDASPTTPDPQRVFMVAVPKNNALTMLLSGDIGYAAAATALEENSAVVLSSGYDVENGIVAAAPNSTATGAAGISIGAGTFSSQLNGSATDGIAVSSGAATQFSADATLNALSSVTLFAGEDASITALGNLTLNAGTGTDGGSIGVSAFGDAITPAASGFINVAGQMTINARGSGTFVAPDAVGGTVTISSDGGDIRFGSLAVDATANASADATRSGNAIGGAITLEALNAGTYTIGSMTLDASGNGYFLSTPPSIGGDGQGGTIRVTGAGGTMDFADVTLRAQATAGTSSTGAAGLATAGDIYVDISSGTHDWTALFADVSSVAGYSTNGGTMAGATPGANGISIDVRNGATLNLSQSISLYGDAYAYGPGSGPSEVRGSNITTRARDGGTLTMVLDYFASAQARGANQVFTQTPTTGPTAFGGNISLSAESGTFSAGSIELYTRANAINADTPGNATAGNVTLFANSPGAQRGSFVLTDCVNASCEITATGSGARGVNGSSGQGGNILIYASDADLTLPGDFTAYASAQAGESRNGDGIVGISGTATAGTVTVESRAGAQNSAVLSLGAFNVDAKAVATAPSEGPSFVAGNGGDAVGGGVVFNILGGQFSADTLEITADSFGGASAVTCPGCDGGGVTPFQAGTGTGGTASFLMAGGTATIGTLTISALGVGGDAESPFSTDSIGAIAGVGRGGTASFEARSGTITVGALTVSAGGRGGAGGATLDANAVDGGASVGGTASFLMDFGSNAVVNVTSLNVSAVGTGGMGGTSELSDTDDAYGAGSGGSGSGGTVDFVLAGGTLTSPFITISAFGTGGDGGRNGSDGAGGNAGSGTGGTAQFTLASEGHSLGVIGVEANGRGGVAGDAKAIVGYDAFGQPIYAVGIGAGGRGGSGTGGRANMVVDVDPILTNLTISANGAGTRGGIGATGGNGGAGNGGTNGLGAQLTVSFGAFTVTNQLDITAEGFGGEGGNGATGRGGDGGIGTAGESGFIATGSSTQVQTNILQIISYGLGGDGGESVGIGVAGGSGGAAFGGTAGLRVADNAQFAFGQRSVISAGAIGGTGRGGTASSVPGTGGAGGAGGSVTGGIARLAVENATLIDGPNGNVQIFAGGLAGVSGPGAPDGGLNGPGGDALGGLAQLESASGSITLNSVTVDASALGARDARGGTASADFFNFVGTALPAPGTANIASLRLDANASASSLGGSIGLGGAGANAIGGTAAATMDGAGIVTQLGSFSATARAFGGSARQGLDAGTAGAAGGTATGGRARFVATGNSQTTLGSSFSLIADATGGVGADGVSGTVGGAGGKGGTAQAGDARFTIDAAQVLATSGDYLISAQATGGAGGAGGNGTNSGASGGIGGNGGDSTGGLALFRATQSDFDLPNLSIFANATGGLGGIGGSGPAFPGNPSATPPVPPSGPIQSSVGLSGGGSGGIAQLLHADTGTLALGAQRSIDGVTMQASGIFPAASTFGVGPTAGRIDITDTSTAAGGGLVINGTLSGTSLGDGACACSGINVSSSANPIQTFNTLLSTDGATSFAFTGGGSLRALGVLNADSGRTITITHSNQPATPVDSLFGGVVSLSAQGNISAGFSTVLRAGNDMSIASQTGSIQLTQLFAGDAIDLTTFNDVIGLGRSTSGGTLTATSGTSMIANFIDSTGGDVVLTTLNGQAQISNSSAAGDFIIDSTGGGVQQAGTVRAGRSISFAGDFVNVGTAIAADDISLIGRAGQASLQNGTTTGIGATGGSNITVTGTTNAVVFNANAIDDVIVTGPTGFVSTSATAGRDIIVQSTNGNTFVNTLNAGRNIDLSASGGVLILSATAAQLLNVNAIAGTAEGGSVNGGSVNVNGNAGINFSTVSSGGTTNLTAANGAILLSALSSVGEVTTMGQSINITGGGALTFTDATATAGDLSLTAGALNVTDAFASAAISLTSTGNLAAGTLDAGVDLLIASQSGSVALTQSVTGNVIDVSAGGSILMQDATAGQLLSINATGGTVQGGSLIGSRIVINGDRGIGFTALNSGGTTNLTAANGAILLPALSSVGAVTATGQSVNITGGGALTFTDATATAGDLSLTAGTLNVTDAFARNSLSLTSTGNLAAGALDVGGDLFIASQSGSVALTQSVTGNVIDVSAGGSIVMQDATAGQLLSIDATSGTAQGGSLIGGQIAVNGNQGINFAAVSSSRTTNLTAANGAIMLPALSSVGAVTATGRSVTIAGTGALTFTNGTATAGDLSLSAGTLSIGDAFASNSLSLISTGELTAGTVTATDDMTLTSGLSTTVTGNIDPRSLTITSGGDVNLGAGVLVTGPLRITAQGTARFQGQVNAQTIDVRSSDIVIGTAGRLGVQGTTQSLILNAAFRQGRDFIGGADQANAYSLSGDEMARLFAQNITINPQGQTTVGGFTLTSGTSASGVPGNLGPNGTLTINSPGRMEIVGAVQLTGLGQQGGLALQAGNGIDLLTDTGSIDLRGSGAALGGVLTIDSVGFYQATRTTLDAITGINIPLDTRSNRLAINDGAVNDQGFTRAGTIRFATPLNLFIQNSGASTAFADRRGFTANSVSIQNATANTEIAINGQLVDASGAFVTGLQAIPLVSINGVGGGQIGSFAARSTANGCLIGNVASCGVIAPTVPEVETQDNRDSIDRIVDPAVAGGQIFPVIVVELRDFVVEGYPPLIDEPVTGAGNEDLWDSDCSVSGDNGCGDSVAP
ncbi:MAG: hypothetical protein V4533_10340 [Pseudomonadota bacterium]|jgi:hypothetical protein